MTHRDERGRRTELSVAIASIVVSLIALAFAVYVPDRIDQSALQRQRIDGCLETLGSLRAAMTTIDVTALAVDQPAEQVAAWVEGQAATEDVRLRCRGLLDDELDDRGERLWTLLAGSMEDVRHSVATSSPHPAAIHEWAGDALEQLTSIAEPTPWWAPWRW